MKNYKIERILVAVDFSNFDQSAVNTAAAIAKRQNAWLTIIHVVPHDNPSDEDYKLSRDTLTNVHHVLKKITSKIYRQFKVKADSMTDIGDPAEVICEVATKEDHSIIVLGTHGHSGIREKIGSVAYSIVEKAPCPVLVVPGEWDRLNFKKIVYPIRMHQKVFEKYNYIEPIIEKNNSELIIAGLAEKDADDNIKETVFSIELLRIMCQEEKISYRTIVLPCNHYSTKLIDTVNNANADLIVISSHLDYDSIKNFIEHFAHDVLNRSKCPVLCISPLLKNKK